MDCIVHGVAKSRTRLSDFHFHTRHMQRSGLQNRGKHLSMTGQLLLWCLMSALFVSVDAVIIHIFSLRFLTVPHPEG